MSAVNCRLEKTEIQVESTSSNGKTGGGGGAAAARVAGMASRARRSHTDEEPDFEDEERTPSRADIRRKGWVVGADSEPSALLDYQNGCYSSMGS